MSTSKNTGCLAAIMRLIGMKPKPTTDSDPDQYPYGLRDDFLSAAERSFYFVLKGMMGEYLTICPKVSLVDIFFVTRPNENMSAYNRINRKHVDFLVCEPKTMKPRLAIELDDSSHHRTDREERDHFVDGVFEAANLPLIHIPARNAYNTAELGALIRQTLQQGTSVSADQKPPGEVDVYTPAPPDQTSDSIPLCPKCGIPMVLRTARQGTQAGKQFYGCTNYPKCRVVIALENQMHEA